MNDKKSPEMVVLVMTPLEALTIYAIVKFEAEKDDSSKELKELEASLLKKVIQSVSLDQMDDCIAEIEVIKLLKSIEDEK
jgi:hypothetical protein